jgi:hypothetical protein
MYLLINQLDYNDSFDNIHIVKLYNFNQSGLWFLIKYDMVYYLINLPTTYSSNYLLSSYLPTYYPHTHPPTHPPTYISTYIFHFRI